MRFHFFPFGLGPQRPGDPNPLGQGPQRPGDPNPLGGPSVFGVPQRPENPYPLGDVPQRDEDQNPVGPQRPGDPDPFGGMRPPKRVLTAREKEAIALIENGTVKKTGDREADLQTALAKLDEINSSKTTTTKTNVDTDVKTSSDTANATPANSTENSTKITNNDITDTSSDVAENTNKEETTTASTSTETKNDTVETSSTKSANTIAQELAELDKYQKATGFGSNKIGNENIDANQNGLIEPEEHLAFRMAADQDADGRPTEFDMSQLRASLQNKDPNAYNLFWSKLNYINDNKSSSTATIADTYKTTDTAASTNDTTTTADSATTKIPASQDLSNLAVTFGVNLTGDKDADTAKVKERANSMLGAIAGINRSNYMFTMPNASATLGVPHTGNVMFDLAQIQAKAASIKAAIDRL